MDLLFKHLGISTPPDLKQGQTFNKGIHHFLAESKYNLLQDGSPSSLITSIETMKNNDTTTLSTLDTKFKQLLSKYTSLLNTVNREILQEQQKYGPMVDYLGKRLKTNEHDIYINEYGYARTFPESTMVDSSCPKSSDLFNNTCQGISDTYGVTYSEEPLSIPTPDYDSICKQANPTYSKVTAVKTPCVADGCNTAGVPGIDMCNSTSKEWSCCADPQSKISTTSTPHLGIKGSNTCPSGMTAVSESKCNEYANKVLPEGTTMGRPLQIGNWVDQGVPPGCSVQSDGDWTAHYNNADGTNTGAYTLICNGPNDDPDTISNIENNRGNTNSNCYAIQHNDQFLLGYPPSAKKCISELPVPNSESCTFDEAKTYCNELQDCNGITQSNPAQGGEFTVRQGIDGLKSWGGTNSWLKKDCSTEKPVEKPVEKTDYGCAPDFAKDWWKQHSCKTKPSSSKYPGCDLNVMNTNIFKQGSDMKPGEPCHLAGKNIRNSNTNEVAWVDLTGTKHVYPNSKMRDNLIGCNTKVTVTLDDNQYSNVPSGTPMNLNSICLNISVNEHDYMDLLKMNNQLQVLAGKIVNELDSLISKDTEMETDIRSKKGTLRKFLSNLKKERKNFSQNKDLLKSMKYQSDEAHVTYISNKYHMIAWGILVVGVGGFTIHQLSTQTSR